MPENTKFLGAVNRLRFPEGRVKVFFDTFFKNIELQTSQNAVLLGSPILPLFDSAINFDIDAQFLKDFVEPIPNIEELVFITENSPKNQKS